VRAGVTGTIEMQSIGQGGRHKSHPVQCEAITECMRFDAPMMASTGHAGIHSVQPMHRLSSITATVNGRSTPLEGFSGSGLRLSKCASASMPTAPPGGH
jgi:hypothetical protein